MPVRDGSAGSGGVTADRHDVASYLDEMRHLRSWTGRRRVDCKERRPHEKLERGISEIRGGG